MVTSGSCPTSCWPRPRPGPTGRRWSTRAGGAVVPYAVLASRIDRVAAGLAADGFRPGDVLAVLAPNVPPWAGLALGAMRAGGAVTGVGPGATDADLARQLALTGATVLVTTGSRLPATRPAGVREVLVLGDAPAGVRPVTDLLASPAPAPEVRLDPARPALLPCSSGTTGLPKAVVLTHANLAAGVAQIGSRSASRRRRRARHGAVRARDGVRRCAGRAAGGRRDRGHAAPVRAAGPAGRDRAAPAEQLGRPGRCRLSRRSRRRTGQVPVGLGQVPVGQRAEDGERVEVRRRRRRGPSSAAAGSRTGGSAAPGQVEVRRPEDDRRARRRAPRHPAPASRPPARSAAGPRTPVGQPGRRTGPGRRPSPACPGRRARRARRAGPARGSSRRTSGRVPCAPSSPAAGRRPIATPSTSAPTSRSRRRAHLAGGPRRRCGRPARHRRRRRRRARPCARAGRARSSPGRPAPDLRPLRRQVADQLDDPLLGPAPLLDPVHTRQPTTPGRGGVIGSLR